MPRVDLVPAVAAGRSGWCRSGPRRLRVFLATGRGRRPRRRSAAPRYACSWKRSIARAAGRRRSARLSRSNSASSCAAIVEAVARQVEPHVLLQLAAGAGDERGVDAGPSAPVAAMSPRALPLGTSLHDRLREEDGVGRHAGVGPGRADDARVERADVGVRASRGRRSGGCCGRRCSVWNERTTVSLSASVGELRHRARRRGRRAATVCAMPVTVRMPSGASGLGSNVSNWLGPPCWNRKMTDLPVTRPGRCSAPAGQQRRQRQPAQAQGADGEEAAAAEAGRRVGEGEHRRILDGRRSRAGGNWR